MKTLSCLLFSCLSDAEPCRYLQTHQALQVGEIALSTNRLWRVSTSGEQLGCSLLPKEQALMYWCVSTEQWGELTVFHAVLELIYLTGELNPYSPTQDRRHVTRFPTANLWFRRSKSSRSRPPKHRRTPLEKPCGAFPSSLQPCKRQDSWGTAAQSCFY